MIGQIAARPFRRRQQPGRGPGRPRPLIRWWRPYLQPGDRGEDVAWLQDWLRQLGYYQGPVDGDFGLLTEDALRQLQQDFGLDQDGRAGMQVQRLMGRSWLPLRRLCHVVQEGQTLLDVAQQLGLSPAALLEENHLRRGVPLYAGQRLHYFSHLLAARWDPGTSQDLLSRLEDRSLLPSFLVIPGWLIGAGASLSPQFPEAALAWARRHGMAVYATLKAQDSQLPPLRQDELQKLVRRVVQGIQKNRLSGVELELGEPAGVWRLLLALLAVVRRRSAMALPASLGSGSARSPRGGVPAGRQNFRILASVAWDPRQQPIPALLARYGLPGPADLLVWRSSGPPATLGGALMPGLPPGLRWQSLLDPGEQDAPTLACLAASVSRQRLAGLLLPLTAVAPTAWRQVVGRYHLRLEGPEA